MDDLVPVGRSKGLGGFIVLAIGILWLLNNYGVWTGFGRWFIPLLIILLGLKLLGQSNLNPRHRRSTSRVIYPRDH